MTYYKLRNDVKNPAADLRHRHDWSKAATFKAGAIFCFDRFDRARGYTGKVGERYMYDITEEQRAAIIAAADVVPEPTWGLIERLGANCMCDLVARLIDKGILTPEQVETEFREWEKTYQ